MMMVCSGDAERAATNHKFPHAMQCILFTSRNVSLEFFLFIKFASFAAAAADLCMCVCIWPG